MSEENFAVDVEQGNNQGADTVAEIQENISLATQESGIQNLDLVMDIPVTLSIELGRTRIRIQDLLELNSGSVVELQRMADEPMDVLVNGTLVAHGEAVVIGEKFGVRLTDVVSAKECFKSV